MIKQVLCTKILILILLAAFVSAGCAEARIDMVEQSPSPTPSATTELHTTETPDTETPPPSFAPEIINCDLSEYFNGLKGAAVLYDGEKYTVYNSELAKERRSPCSTFKIIASLIALENGILMPENSTRTWSGEVFWNDEWNRDIDFKDAFSSSCVWYYRQLMDDMGAELIQSELDRLNYGNGDISDWEGRLNTNNDNRALTGFWIESSLLISPMEQTDVMERIFGEDSVYAEHTRDELKRVMKAAETENGTVIYGKTGMGKDYGVTVDAWFVGFAEGADGNVYFSVYLGRSDGMNVTSAKARDIAIKIISDIAV